MPSILIADDHAMIRTGLRHYLEQDRSIDKIGETGTGAQTLRELREGNWTSVILISICPAAVSTSCVIFAPGTPIRGYWS
jgi:DNA-binding NarL/FixJ family response regulator